MITQIIWLLTWPLLIAISYFFIYWTVKRYVQNEELTPTEDPLK
jgi:hypothetical protein